MCVGMCAGFVVIVHITFPLVLAFFAHLLKYIFSACGKSKLPLVSLHLIGFC